MTITDLLPKTDFHHTEDYVTVRGYAAEKRKQNPPPLTDKQALSFASTAGISSV